MKFGFIGTGNMASAIIRGARRDDVFQKEEIFGYDCDVEKAQALQADCGIKVCQTMDALIEACDYLVLAVKPQTLDTLLPALREKCKDKRFITIAAGKTLSYYETMLGAVAVVRVMPNINARVGAATSCFCANAYADAKDIEAVCKLFSTVGTILELPEAQFSAFTAIAGSSPAFSYMYIDALAKAGVRAGLPRATALAAAAGSVLGSAKLVLQGDTHPCDLADQVCSPGGTTIDGVYMLHRGAFEGLVEEAVAAVIEKEKKL